ncbi:MAG TPA: O-antigen polymerase [Steroidobacteraceae bacterium]|nr:O-antigen polymerase [Steroidobacteraceae bacterium]
MSAVMMPGAAVRERAWLIAIVVPCCVGLAFAANAHALLVLALLACAILAIPLLVRRQRLDLFAPWNYLCYFVLLNVLARSILIDLDLTGGNVNLDDIFYLGKGPGFLVASMGVMLLGFAFLTFGYLLAPHRPHVLHWHLLRAPIDRRRLDLTLILMLLTSAAAFVAFVYVTFDGVADFAWRLLSSHRGLSDDLTEYRGYGYLRLLAGLSTIVIYLTYLQLRTERRRRARYRLALLVAVLISTAMAFYSQSRAALIFPFLNLLFMKYYLDGRRFPWRVFTVFLPLVVALFIITSSLRAGAGVDLTQRVTPMTIVAPIILTNGGIDASKTGHIIDYVDDTQDYKLGQTLVQFLWAAVPRELWVNKPPNLDTFVGEKIYGAETFGAAAVPAGFFGEMYLNFWYAGIVVGALLLGLIVRRIDNLLAGNLHSAVFIMCYVVLLQSIGMSVLASGVSSTIIGVLTAGVPLLLVLRFITRGPAAPRAE